MVSGLVKSFSYSFDDSLIMVFLVFGVFGDLNPPVEFMEFKTRSVPLEFILIYGVVAYGYINLFLPDGTFSAI